MIAPDIVLAGAARSGTTALAANLSRHPLIDAPKVKEPNYFTSNWDRGAAWYSSLFSGRGLKLDASVQYSYPRLMATAFERMSPPSTTRILYLAREPISRTYSHYCREVHYQGRFEAKTFGEGMAANADALTASDYNTIIPALEAVAPGRVLVLPFELVGHDELVARVLTWLGLDPAQSTPPDANQEKLYRNEQSQISSPLLRRAFKRARRSRIYPTVRSVVGPANIRKLRGRMSSRTGLPTLDDALSSCSSEQLQRLQELALSSASSISETLAKQDERLGTAWKPAADWVVDPLAPLTKSK